MNLICLPQQKGEGDQDWKDGREEEEEGEEQQRQLDCSRAFPGWDRDLPNGVVEGASDGEFGWFGRLNLEGGKLSNFWDFENGYEKLKCVERQIQSRQRLRVQETRVRRWYRKMFSKMENEICLFWFWQHQLGGLLVLSFQPRLLLLQCLFPEGRKATCLQIPIGNILPKNLAGDWIQTWGDGLSGRDGKRGQ